MQRGGASLLVALDAVSLDVRATRVFPDDEYLADCDARDALVRHSRGLAQRDDTLFVAMFNSVQGYVVRDIARLDISPTRQLTHELAVDLHGLCLHGNELIAASTGSDRLIAWSASDSVSSVTALSKSETAGDLRFPLRKARSAGLDDWRDALPGTLHINSVFSVDRETIGVSGLRSIWMTDGYCVTCAYHDDAALFHDGCVVAGDRILVSDASRGGLVMIDRDGKVHRRISISDASRAFVRGVCELEGYAFTLASEVGPTHQRAMRACDREETCGSAWFDVAVVDLGSGVIEAKRTIALENEARGAVAYALTQWTTGEFPQTGTMESSIGPSEAVSCRW